MKPLNWEGGFTLDVLDKMKDAALWSARHLSQMKAAYADQQAAEAVLADEDPVIYEFQELGVPETEGDLAFGAGVLHPGKIGDEFYMTKGHFHKKLETAEVYLGLSGEGLLLIESPDGTDSRVLEMKPMQAVYVPKGYAHRTINTGDEDLTYFFAFPAEAGHDYGTIELKGFRNLIIAADRGWKIVENPKWS